jgi:inner membrane protein
MFILGHLGITLGSALAVAGIISHWPRRSVVRLAGRPDSPASLTTARPAAGSNRSPASAAATAGSASAGLGWLFGLKPLSRFLDIRVLLVGAVLPDIVDKPLAYFGFGDGRSITHTLLVFLVVLVTAFYIYLNHRRTWLLAIAIGMFSHLVLDSIWSGTHTFLWPVYGWGFVRPLDEPGLGQIKIWWHTLATNPGVDISEGIGLAVILVFTWVLAAHKKMGSFLLKGKA